jgi:hypothetical protein
MTALDNIKKKYVVAAKTNILDTFRSTGWTPPSEDLKHQKKWATYRHLASRNEVKNV